MLKEMQGALKETQRIAGTYKEATNDDGEYDIEPRTDIAEIMADNQIVLERANKLLGDEGLFEASAESEKLEEVPLTDTLIDSLY